MGAFRLAISLLALLLAAPALGAEQYRFPLENRPVVLRDREPFVVHVDPRAYPGFDFAARLPGELGGFGRELPDAQAVIGVMQSLSSGLVCTAACGDRSCVSIGVSPLRSQEELLAMLAGTIHEGQAFACPLPAPGALEAFLEAREFGNALLGTGGTEGSRLMEEVLTVDAFAILLVARERGPDAALVEAVARARAAAPFYIRPEYATEPAIRAAGEVAARRFGGPRRPTPNWSLIAAFEPPYLDLRWNEDEQVLRGLFRNAGWRLFQPRFGSESRFRRRLDRARSREDVDGRDYLEAIPESSSELRRLEEDDMALIRDAQALIQPFVWNPIEIDDVSEAMRYGLMRSPLGTRPQDWIARLDRLAETDGPLPARVLDLRAGLGRLQSGCPGL